MRGGGRGACYLGELHERLQGVLLQQPAPAHQQEGKDRRQTGQNFILQREPNLNGEKNLRTLSVPAPGVPGLSERAPWGARSHHFSAQLLRASPAPHQPPPRPPHLPRPLLRDEAAPQLQGWALLTGHLGEGRADTPLRAGRTHAPPLPRFDALQVSHHLLGLLPPNRPGASNYSFFHH